MCKLKFLLTFLSLILLIQTGQCQSCEQDSVYKYSYGLICQNISAKFPDFLKPVSYLKCINCDIVVLDSQTIPDIANIRFESFNITQSRLQKISASAFQNFNYNSMHIFSFEDNVITSIEQEAFSQFKALDTISFTQNYITSLNKWTFNNTNVTLLNLSFNHLGNINSGLEGLRVNKLNLSHNEITDLSPNAFDNTIFWEGRQWRRGIQFLDLSYNLINKILPNTFKSYGKENNFRFLYLQGNKISAIDSGTFSNLSLLNYLSLGENQISTLYNESFKGLTELTTLELNKNSIETLPLGLFFDLHNLNHLDLSENKITTLTINTFSGLIKLTLLNVSYNSLKVLNDQALYPVGRLTHLDVSGTNLQSLNIQDLFEHHPKLQFLAINDNFWTCSDLVKMYKVLNKKTNGFSNPSRRYDIPNLHGIACSQQKLSDYEDMTFDEFLEIISQDRVFEDNYDTRFKEQSDFEDDINLVDIKSALQSVNGIFYMVTVITIIVVIIFLQFIVRCVFRYLYWHKTLSSDKFSFMYARNQDNVELIN